MKHIGSWLRSRVRWGHRSPKASTPAEVERARVENANWWYYWSKEDRGWIFTAPVTNPQAILHVQCGTGRWALEVATQFPQARVVGLAPTLPDPRLSLGHGIAQVPINLTFIVGTNTQPLPFAAASFDFVFLGTQRGSLPADAWPTLIREVARVLRPGGWVESIESISLLKNNTPGMGKILEWGNEVQWRAGRDPLVALKIPQMFKQEGYVNVTTTEVLQAVRTRYDQRSRERRTISGTRMIGEQRANIIAAGVTDAATYDRVATSAREELKTNQQSGGTNVYDIIAQKPTP